MTCLVGIKRGILHAACVCRHRTGEFTSKQGMHARGRSRRLYMIHKLSRSVCAAWHRCKGVVMLSPLAVPQVTTNPGWSKLPFCGGWLGKLLLLLLLLPDRGCCCCCRSRFHPRSTHVPPIARCMPRGESYMRAWAGLPGRSPRSEPVTRFGRKRAAYGYNQRVGRWGQVSLLRVTVPLGVVTISSKVTIPTSPRVSLPSMGENGGE